MPLRDSKLTMAFLEAQKIFRGIAAPTTVKQNDIRTQALLSKYTVAKRKANSHMTSFPTSKYSRDNSTNDYWTGRILVEFPPNSIRRQVPFELILNPNRRNRFSTGSKNLSSSVGVVSSSPIGSQDVDFSVREW